MKAILAGDTHGNYEWFRRYLFPVAMVTDADALIVLGDFGAWEHTEAGRTFMDDVDIIAGKAGVTLYWLHGNHDKWSHTVAHYRLRDDDGFLKVRENVRYIPQGHSWNWQGVNFRSFGGAYSIDKSWRVEEEQLREVRLKRAARAKVGGGGVFGSDEVPSQTGTLWFPEEEMTDDELEQLLHDDFGIKDVILSHDKPMSATPGWDRKQFPACVPNQMRLERALKVHKPRWWFHGHLHFFYTDQLAGPGFKTDVVGLEPDNNAADNPGWKRENTFVELNLMPGWEPRIRLGQHVELPQAQLAEARAVLAS